MTPAEEQRAQKALHVIKVRSKAQAHAAARAVSEARLIAARHCAAGTDPDHELQILESALWSKVP